MGNAFLGSVGTVYPRYVLYAVMAGKPSKSIGKGKMIHWAFLLLAILGAYFVYLKWIAKKI
jgi:hypothetical protein